MFVVDNSVMLSKLQAKNVSNTGYFDVFKSIYCIRARFFYGN